VIPGALLMVAANAASILAAAGLTKRLGTGRRATDLTLFLLIRLLLIMSAVLLGGLTHTLTRWALGLTGTAALIMLLVARTHRTLPRVDFREVGKPLLIAAVVVSLRLLAQVWLFAPHLGDAVAYHLPKVGEWVRAGGFTGEMGLHPHVAFPAGFELVETWWVLFLGHDVLIEMAGVEFVALGFAATGALARHVGIGRRASFFAGLLYVVTPGFHLSATSCLNDAPAAALVVTTMTLVAARAPWPLVLVAVGLGVGIKPTYGFALPGAALLAFLLRLEPAVPLNRWAFALTAGGLLLGGFWYVRNIAWYGNPFFPLGSEHVVNPTAVQLGPRSTSLVDNVGDLVTKRLYDHQGAYGANVDNIAGWGPVAFGVGIPALLLGAAQNHRLRRLAIGFSLSLTCVLLFVQNDPWNLKYVFFFPALLIVAAARLAEMHRPVWMLTAFAFGFSFLATILPYDMPPQDLLTLARQTWRHRSALEISEPRIPDVVVGCLGGYRARSYLLYGPDFSRRVVYLRPQSQEDLEETLRLFGIRYLYAAPANADQRAMLDGAVGTLEMRLLGKHVYGPPRDD